MKNLLDNVLCHFQNYFSHVMATAYKFIHPLTSTGLGSEVSFQRTVPRKNLDDLVWLESEVFRLRVADFTTWPCGNPNMKS